jgi:hypothetical protein
VRANLRTVPPILETLAVVSLLFGVLCVAIIALDTAAGRRQKMWIMNTVWPVTGLYSGPLGLWAYLALGRAGKSKGERLMPQAAGLAALHCGAGCTLGDLIAEWGILLFPFTLLGNKIFAGWMVDFVCAYLIGIVFQYFTIAPMRNLPPGKGIVAAVKADTLSLSAWQIGMYGWMAIVMFLIFGRELEKTDPVFWFMMQIAMLAGFLTAYPVNWMLVRIGWKEKM